jgi:putative colanic acid biosynthesis acetyltransferase WcaF
MPEDRTVTYQQSSAYMSARPVGDRLMQIWWEYVWNALCAWTPKPCNAWRLMWLRIFGAKLYGKPFVHQSARIHVPWNLTMHDRSALGERATAYSLGEIELLARCTVAQEVYLCGASHEFNDLNLPLTVGKITVGEDAFIGARAFIFPGVVIGTGALVGACSVVTRDVPPWMVAVGNPSKVIKRREIVGQSKDT